MKNKDFREKAWYAAIIIIILCFISLGLPLILYWIISDVGRVIAFGLGILAVIAIQYASKNN